MSSESEVKSMKIVGGALVDAPVYQKHKRGRNWMAKIRPNALVAGGWEREFMPQGPGDMLYIVSRVFPGDVLEFGADYTTTLGKRTKSRKYAFVVSIDTLQIRVREFDNAMDAWSLSMLATRTPPVVVEMVETLNSLSVEDRISVLDAFCAGCGKMKPALGPTCSCDSSRRKQ